MKSLEKALQQKWTREKVNIRYEDKIRHRKEVIYMVHLGNDWAQAMQEVFASPHYQKLREVLKEEYRTQTIYPPMEEIYTALKVTALEATRVVIIGQDPYHGPGQANGMSFSVKKGIPLPPSLQNIYKEIESSTGVQMPNHGDLTYWAEQGVLLLNNVLTVRAHEAASHHGIGWEEVTDAILDKVNAKAEPVIILLWGNPAKKKGARITNPRHVVLTAPHPSPLAAYRGFFGCNHFKTVNELLVSWGKVPIDWQLPS